MISRRSLLATGAYALAAPYINRGRVQLFAQSELSYSTLTLDLIRSATVVDMLGLLTVDYKKLWTWQSQDGAFRAEDLDALRRSGTTVFHPAVGFVKGDIYESSVRDLTRWNLFLARHADQFIRVAAVPDIDLAKASSKIGVILGLQNSEHFRTAEDVDFFYSLGQRISQLTYYNNRLGAGSTDSSRGLTVFGAQIVGRMNDLGMAVDISHCGDRTTLDAIEVSRKPVLVTHSNCRALVASSARCKTDEAIRKLAWNGGVLGVTMVRPFVRRTGRATVEHVLDHIDHVASIAGVEHAGLGTDVDLEGREPVARTSDLDGVRYSQKIFDLTEGLVRRKYTRADIELILGGNFRRALAAIWNS